MASSPCSSFECFIFILICTRFVFDGFYVRVPYELREVKARKAAKKAAAKSNVVAMKAKPMASKQKGGNVM